MKIIILAMGWGAVGAMPASASVIQAVFSGTTVNRYEYFEYLSPDALNGPSYDTSAAFGGAIGDVVYIEPQPFSLTIFYDTGPGDFSIRPFQD